jgi:hypothetical protein|tara:strand:+ start:677 stop:1165 length:489 start_codon:yes stop_codon:yes gene_type:complete
MNYINEAVKQAMTDYRFREIFNHSPTMIHEDNYEELNCVLCNKEMKTIHDTHNAFPLAKLQSAKEAYEQDTHYRCCTECNKNKVMPKRLNMFFANKNTNDNRKKLAVKAMPMSEAINYFIKNKNKVKSMFVTPESQKRFKELNQNYYETELGKSEREKEKNE